MSIKDKNYIIVYGPDEVDNYVETPYELEDELEELYEKSQKGKASIKHKLEKYIKRYPKLPFLRNYLVVWHVKNEQIKEASRLNDEMLRLFPDYIFSLAFKVEEYLIDNNTQAIEALLNGRFDIGAFYPDRKVFHLSEFKAFISILVNYYASTYEFEEAEAQIALLEEVELDNVLPRQLKQVVTKYRLQRAAQKIAEYKKTVVRALQQEDYTLQEQNVLMEASSPEFEFLYCGQWDIDIPELKECINSNKEGLIAECERILTIAITGYGYIQEVGDWSAAVLNALLILPYLDDEATLPSVIEFYRQPADCQEFWVMDWGDTVLARYFKNFSEAKLEMIYNFLVESPGNTSSKIVFLCELPKFVLHAPESREKLLQCLKNVFEHFAANREDAHLFDTDVIAFTVNAAIHLKATELLETIAALYKKGWVSVMVSATIEEVREEIASAESSLTGEFFDDVYSHIRDVTEQFQRINKPFDDDYYDDDGLDEDELDEDLFEMFANETKKPEKINYGTVSKNAPCPCGSGKKYKRCHGM